MVFIQKSDDKIQAELLEKLKTQDEWNMKELVGGTHEMYPDRRKRNWTKDCANCRRVLKLMQKQKIDRDFWERSINREDQFVCVYSVQQTIFKDGHFEKPHAGSPTNRSRRIGMSVQESIDQPEGNKRPLQAAPQAVRSHKAVAVYTHRHNHRGVFT